MKKMKTLYAILAFLFLYLALSCHGWIKLFLGYSSHGQSILIVLMPLFVVLTIASVCLLLNEDLK